MKTLKFVCACLLLVLSLCSVVHAQDAAINLFDQTGNLSANSQFDKSINADKTQTNNLSLEGSLSWQTINSNTQVQISAATVYNRRSGGTSGTLRLELWALNAPYSGGGGSGIKMGQGQLNPLPAGSYYSGVVRTSAYSPPTQSGTYYVSLFLTEYSSSNTSNDGYGIVDWGNFSNTLVIGGSPVGGAGLTIPGAWTWQISSGIARITTERIVNGRASGTSGSLRLELWALASSYAGGAFQGYKIAEQSYNPLPAGTQYTNIDFSRNANLPPTGSWYVVLMLTEYSSSNTFNNGYGTVDYRNSSSLLTIGTPPPPPPPTGGTLTNGVPVTGISGAMGSSLAFSVAIPAGASNLLIRVANGSGDPDLYVRYGSPVTATVYDCSSTSVGVNDSCTFANPVAGTYHILIFGYTSYSGLSLTATWQTGTATTTVDEPGFSNFLLPLPNPAFPNCPGGYFVASVEDGSGAGLTRGTFGLGLTLNAPGTQRLEGGLNFGGLLDGSQAAFAGFNFTNPANEQQRLDLIVVGNPATSQVGTLPVRIKVFRQPAAGVNELVFETTANLTLAQQFVRSIVISPAFYVVSIAPEGNANSPFGPADGEVYVSLATQFVNRPGGGFFGGVVVGGYHATHPFGGVSGFASFCLGTSHSASAQVYSAPTYGSNGARDLRLRLFDHVRNSVLTVPGN